MEKKKVKVQVLVTYSKLEIIDVEVEGTGDEQKDGLKAIEKAERIVSFGNNYVASGAIIENIESTVL